AAGEARRSGRRRPVPRFRRVRLHDRSDDLRGRRLLLRQRMAHPPRIDFTLYFVRHGQTEMNRLGRLQGRGGFGLLPEGLKDAARAADELARRGIRVLYSSDQQRALETARIIRTTLGLRDRV